MFRSSKYRTTTGEFISNLNGASLSPLFRWYRTAGGKDLSFYLSVEYHAHLLPHIYNKILIVIIEAMKSSCERLLFEGFKSQPYPVKKKKKRKK